MQFKSKYYCKMLQIMQSYEILSDNGIEAILIFIHTFCNPSM